MKIDDEISLVIQGWGRRGVFRTADSEMGCSDFQVTDWSGPERELRNLLSPGVSVAEARRRLAAHLLGVAAEIRRLPECPPPLEPTAAGLGWWEPRVLRHASGGLAVHEVYFPEGGDVEGYTTDALSPLAPSVPELRDALLQLLATQDPEVTCGDLGYSYSREYVQDWLDCLGEPPLHFE